MLKITEPIKLNIILHKNQQKINESTARFKVIEAGKRFGKSYEACYEIAKMAQKPGLYWYIAPTYGMAESIAWHTLLWILPEKVIKRKLETKLLIELWNGSRIILKGADKEDSLRGPGIDGGVMDEAAYVDGYIWPNILRGQLAGSQGPFVFISSPHKNGRTWFTKLCEDAVNLADHEFFHFTIEDNPTLAPAEVQKIKDGCTEDAWNLEYLAITPSNSGQLFSEFDYSRHVKEFAMKEPGYNARSLDWGIDHPLACVWANFDASKRLDPITNPVYIYDEYCKSDTTIEESCNTIKVKTGAKAIEWSVIDPSCKRRIGIDRGAAGKMRTLADEFARNGITCIPGNNQAYGYDIVKMFFKKDLIRIHPNCKNLISQIKNLQYGEDVADDLTDCARYLLVRIHDVNYSANIFDNIKNAEELNPHRYDACVCSVDPYHCTIHPREIRMADLGGNDNTGNEMSWMMEDVA